MDKIEVRGARTHNLKNINLVIPRDKLIVVTGLSGSGKSSLAFDTLYAEGQRRYVESLSAYARQFLSLMEKPDVDHIEGLSPAISIEQKSTSHNPRSTVGTITEIHDYLRLLFARVGEPRCPDHDVPLAAQTVSQMGDNVLSHQSLKSAKANTPKRWRTWQARVTSVLVLMAKSAIFPIRRNWNCKRNIPLKWWLIASRCVTILPNVLPSHLKPRWSFPVVQR